jgi:CHAT domain-containing protein
VVDAFRNPGNAAISVAPGVTLNSGTGDISVIQSTGAGLTNNSSGDITLDNIIAGNVLVENNGQGGGNISVNGTVTATGTVSMSANGNISTEDITTNGGLIDLTSNSGSLTSGNLTTASPNGGGAITLTAEDSITAGILDSSSSVGNGGNVTLDPIGDIQVSYINAQGGSSGTGGTVNINTQQFFRATNTFTDANGVEASISTAGGNGGGNITIAHGGNGVTPFVVGDATINGTTADITSGNVTIALPQSFLFTYTQGNIGIISVDPPPVPPVPSPVPPAPSPIPPIPSTEPTEPAINPVDLTNSQNQVVSLPPIQNNNNNNTNNNIDALEIDDLFSRDFIQYLGLNQTQGITLTEARNTLSQIEAATGIKPALIYVVFVPETITPAPTTDQSQSQGSSAIAQSSLLRSLTPQPSDRMELILITAEGKPVRQSINATRAEVISMANEFRTQVTDINKPGDYLTPAQKMYQWLVAPLEQDLQQLGIKNLAYIMDTGLRSIPLAALHDGKGFIVERYSVGLMPSLALTNTPYKDVKNLEVLAMGADQFTDQKPLPAVPVELSAIAGNLWPGKFFLNEEFTLKNLQSARSREPYGIIHLATHAEFKPGKPSNSYIQFWDSKLRLDQLAELDLNKPPVELLVLSACRTARGDKEAELGFAGLAVQAGVKSALGSLWNVSDEGTLGLMTEFYEQLTKAPIKAEALRQAQLAMSKGEVRLQDGQLVTSRGNFPLPPQLVQLGNKDLTHPYYWSAFTMIGNPW